MLVYLGGRERTLEELTAITGAAGSRSQPSSQPRRGTLIACILA